jgi:hypothetical protein
VPVKLRRAKGRRRRADQVPAAVHWWLENGCTAEGNDADAWLVSNLHFDRTVAPGCWTRADLRELGYGSRIDAHIAAGRCPQDGWRR